MPRAARIKNDSGIYHIMVRSISDVPLFRDNKDKEKYIQLVKKYKLTFLFNVYAYCLMTTHAHMIIDTRGADISKIMKSINQCYSAYFNKKYNRHGHVFQDRFKSKLVDDENYALTLSAYIHNNCRDISKYKKCPEKYKYSTLGIYLGLTEDKFKILDNGYILGHFSENIDIARKSYLEFMNRVSESSQKIDVEFKEEGSDCRNERRILVRDFSYEEIVKFISKYINTCSNIRAKFTHKNTKLKALCIFVIRVLCNLSLTDICHELGNITISNICRLYNIGYSLITEEKEYENLIDDVIVGLAA